jgi:crossover junction endodeoxyribonuclease RusA|tara:strand:+ start:64 stop:447 length:384 start_codon:yes stop_codon:yes gene_type:complete
MKPTVRLELPYPPSVNSYWRANGHRRFISKEGVAFTKEVDLIVKQSRAKSFGENRIAISVMIHPRSKRKFDLDNTLKAILDALMKAGMYNDDSQIDFIEIARGEAVPKGAAIIYLYDFKGEEHGTTE